MGAPLEVAGGDGEQDHEEEIDHGREKIAAEKEKVLRGEILDEGEKPVELDQEGDGAVLQVVDGLAGEAGDGVADGLGEDQQKIDLAAAVAHGIRGRPLGGGDGFVAAHEIAGVVGGNVEREAKEGGREGRQGQADGGQAVIHEKQERQQGGADEKGGVGIGGGADAGGGMGHEEQQDHAAEKAGEGAGEGEDNRPLDSGQERGPFHPQFLEEFAHGQDSRAIWKNLRMRSSLVWA